MVFVGIDHSTTGVKTAITTDDGGYETFTIERSPDEDGDWSFIERLANNVALEEIDLVANSYSYGDGFSEITDIDEVEGRGVVDHMGAGHGFGTGTQVFDALAESDLPCVLYPGVHDGLDCLHPYFRHYSVYCGADMVAMTRLAKEAVAEREGVDSPSFVASCVSSSSMATVVVEGTLKGAFHWIGLIHGHVDVELLREIQAGEECPEDAFMKSGLLYRSDKSFEQIKGVPDEELLETLYWSTLHNIYSLAPFPRYTARDGLDAIVLSGRLASVREPFDLQQRLTSAAEDLAPTHHCSAYATARGAAMIARDVYEGAEDVLGIPVGSVPVKSVTA